MSKTKKSNGLGAWFVEAITTDNVALPSEAELIDMLGGKAPPLTINADAEITTSTDAATQPAPQQQQLFLPAPRDEISGNADERGNFKETKTIMKQNFENLPSGIRDFKRFFKVGANKHPHDKGWSKLENQKFYHDVIRGGGFAGFDTCGHGTYNDFLFVDFDHVLDDDGNFVTAEAEACYNNLVKEFRGIYVERSISGHGLHAFLVPNPEKFEPVSSGERGKLFFSEDHSKDAPALELFYKSAGRYCFVTGDKFRDCGDELPGEVGTDEDVDEYFQSLLDQIQAQNAAQQPQPQPEPSATETATTDAATTTATADDFASANNLEPTPLDEIIKPRDPAADDSQATDEKSWSDSGVAQGTKQDTDFSADPPALVLDKVRECLKLIDPSALGYGDWLPLMSGCKGAGLTFEEFDLFAARDTAERYTPKENLASWDSSHGDFTEKVVISIAQKQANFDPAAFTAQWYQDHPEYSSRRSSTKAADPKATATGNMSKDLRDFLFNQITGTNDQPNALRFMALEGAKFRFLTDDDCWVVYDKNVWRIAPAGKKYPIYPLATDAALTLAAAAKTKAENKIAEPLTNQHKVVPMLDKVKSLTPEIVAKIPSATIWIPDVFITTADLDKNPNLLNCRNGVVDLQTGKLYAHTPSLLMTKQANVIYRAGYRNETVENFLNKIQPDEETLHALLVFIGYCLTGENDVEKFLVWKGLGGNGKGTLSQTLMYLLGDYATELNAAAILKAKRIDANAATTALNVLIGKRLALINELPQGAKLDVAQIKRLTGGDLISLRKLFNEAFSIRLVVKLIISGNDPLEVDDVRDQGFLRRFLHVPFDVTIKREEANTNLKRTLITDDCLSGLLTLGVEGAMEYYRNHDVIESAVMKRAAGAYLAAQDWLGTFIKENCVFVEKAEIYRADFLAKLRESRPVETYGRRDHVLTDMILKIDGIGYGRDKRGCKFTGIGWVATDEK